jgi:hypothetical protein
LELILSRTDILVKIKIPLKVYLSFLPTTGCGNEGMKWFKDREKTG